MCQDKAKKLSDQGFALIDLHIGQRDALHPCRDLLPQVCRGRAKLQHPAGRPSAYRGIQAVSASVSILDCANCAQHDRAEPLFALGSTKTIEANSNQDPAILCPK